MRYDFSNRAVAVVTAERLDGAFGAPVKGVALSFCFGLGGREGLGCRAWYCVAETERESDRDDGQERHDDEPYPWLETSWVEVHDVKRDVMEETRVALRRGRLS